MSNISLETHQVCREMQQYAKAHATPTGHARNLSTSKGVGLVVDTRLANQVEEVFKQIDIDLTVLHNSKIRPIQLRFCEVLEINESLYSPSAEPSIEMEVTEDLIRLSNDLLAEAKDVQSAYDTIMRKIDALPATASQNAISQTRAKVFKSIHHLKTAAAFLLNHFSSIKNSLNYLKTLDSGFTELNMGNESFIIAKLLLIGKKWTPIKVLGSGSYGKVTLYKLGDLPLAIKQSHVDTPEERAGFIHETTLAYLTDLKSLTVRPVALESRRLLIYMRPAKCTLTTFANKLIQTKQLNYPRILAIVNQFKLILDSLHDLRILHRDIKPDNMLVTSSRGKLSIRIADFGLSCLQETMDYKHKEKRSDTLARGTIDFIAPEVLTGAFQDHAIDLWSTGATLFQLITGTPINKALALYFINKNPASDLAIAYQNASNKLTLGIMTSYLKDHVKDKDIFEVLQGLENKPIPNLNGQKLPVGFLYFLLSLLYKDPEERFYDIDAIDGGVPPDAPFEHPFGFEEADRTVEVNEADRVDDADGVNEADRTVEVDEADRVDDVDGGATDSEASYASIPERPLPTVVRSEGDIFHRDHHTEAALAGSV